MGTRSETAFSGQFVLPSIDIASMVLLFITGIAFGLLSVYHPVIGAIIALSLIGIISVKFKPYSIFVIVFSLAPLVGIVRVFVGSRIAPLTLDILLMLSVLVAVCSIILKRENFKIGFIGWLIFLIFLLSFFQMFNPNVPSLLIGAHGFRGMAYQMLGFFAALFLIDSQKKLKQINLIFIIVAVLVATYGIKQYFLPTVVDARMIHASTVSPIGFTATGTGVMRAFSTMTGPFQLGLYMVLSILLSLCLLSRRYFPILFSLIMVMLLCLFLTITRTNWVILILGLSVYFLLINRTRVIRTFLMISVSALVVIGLLFLLRDHPRFATVFILLNSLSDPFGTSSYQFRVSGWQDVIIPAMMNNPFGYGTGCAMDGLKRMFLSGYSFTSHNLYFKFALETGVISLILYLIIIWRCLRLGISNSYQLKSPYLKKYSCFIVAFITAISMAGLFGPFLDAYPVNLYFWFLLGVLSKLHSIDSKEAACKTIIKEHEISNV